MRPNPLPQPLTNLIGRTDELHALGRLLLDDAVRLLTLIGPGGIGKTRLGILATRQLADHFQDGAVFVPLAPVSSPAAVTDAIGQALSLNGSDRQTIAEQIHIYLQERELLLFLDNFEHLVDAAPNVADLLQNCPKVKVLTTSRMPLHISGEHLYPVPPLAQPQPQLIYTAADLAEIESVQLFVQRARAANPTFQLSDGNATVIGQICARLEGLPLAIELAAPIVRILPLPAILSRLDPSIDLLVGGPRDLPPRQRALRSAIAWSYELLDEAEQRLFRRLAVFTGGCGIEATAAVCQAVTEDAGSVSVLRLLASLVDKSLLVRAGEEEGEPRFGMLESIREYALEQLENRGEVERLRQAHADYFLALAEAGERGLQSTQQEAWVLRLAGEHSNLRAAQGWAQATDDGALALRFCGALWRFWVMRGQSYEGRRWVAETLDLVDYDGRVPTWAVEDTNQGRTLAKVLGAAGILAYFQSDFGQAAAMWEQSLALSHRLEEGTEEAFALYGLAAIARERGDYTLAHRLYAESLAIYRRLDDWWGIGEVQHNVALTLHYFQDDSGAALPISQESLSIFRSLGATWEVGNELDMLGNIKDSLGDYRAARLYTEEALALAERLGDRARIARGLLHLGVLALRETNRPAAAALFRRSLNLYKESGRSRFGLYAILYTASLLADQQPGGAAQLLGAFVTLTIAWGIGGSSAYTAEVADIVARVRAAQDSAQFETAWQQGTGLSNAQVTDLALALLDSELSAPKDPTPTVLSSPLTPRELEVLQLVASGLTDAQVAEKLVISPRTVNTHMTSIFNKLGVSSRMAAAWAAQERKLL